jgi:DNA-binding beta-propeller fold protein YncE
MKFRSSSPRLRLPHVVLASVLLGGPLAAGAADPGGPPDARLFRHVATFDVMAGNGSAVAEIVDVSPDGKQLVYTDASNGAVGFVDIRALSNPQGQGTMPVGGSPTSVAILGRLALVAVDTSGSFTNPSGKLVVIDRFARAVVAEHALGGQPDSIALAPDGKRAVIVIENQRDEEENDGLPQAPSGKLLIVSLTGAPASWAITEADLAPVAAAAVNGTDLEPEFVDVNDANLAVVSFQENNHLAIVDIVTGATIAQFPAGTTTLTNVDTAEDALISLDSSIERRREPDAVAWIDDDSFATANEGDYEDENGEIGGSRGFTVFNVNGTVEFESAASFEHWLARVGHYNEDRSENKGVEPEAAEIGLFGARKLLFVASERSNAVGVYDVTSGAPVPLQVLPTGIGPEGVRAAPCRDLLVVSTETDEAGIGIPTMINLYALRNQPARYPMVESADDANGNPIPWVALSGLAGDLVDPDTLYAVSDAFLASGFIYTLDVSAVPARIIDRLEVTGSTDPFGLDLEGIAVGPDGNFWVGSEGGNPGARSNRVLKVDRNTGAVLAEYGLPAGLEALRRSNGIEGLAVTGSAGAEVVFVAIQRAWPAAGDTDAVNTKIGRFDVATGQWTFVHYPLQPLGNGDWIGLSELTLLPDGAFAVIERDKGWGPTTGFNAELKALYRVDLAGAEFRAYGDPAGLVTIDKALLADLLPPLAARSIWTPEKLEGFAVNANRRGFVVTDNDGVDGATGETLLLQLPGRFAR